MMSKIKGLSRGKKHLEIYICLENVKNKILKMCMHIYTFDTQ